MQKIYLLYRKIRREILNYNWYKIHGKTPKIIRRGGARL